LIPINEIRAAFCWKLGNRLHDGVPVELAPSGGVPVTEQPLWIF